MKKVVVRKYRCWEPLNMGQDVITQLWLQNQMWNKLVEMEQNLYKKYREVMSTDTAVAEIEEKLTQNDTAIKAYMEERNEIRKKLKKKKCAETAYFDEQIKELSAESKELRKIAREKRKEAKEKVKPLLDEINQERKERRKKIYQNSGLFWGNYNRVMASFDIAVSKSMKTGSTLRFHRFDGTGIFKNFLSPGRTNDDMLNGKLSYLHLQDIPAESFNDYIGRNNPCKMVLGSRRERSRKYGLLKFTIYRGKDEEGNRINRMLEMPVLLHRPLPDDEDLLIKEAVVRRECVSPGEYRWFFILTYVGGEFQPVQHVNTGSVAGINMGWKTVNNNTLRIATLVSDKETVHFILPEKIMKTYDYLNQLKSEVDSMINHAIARIKEIMKDDDELPESMGVYLTRITKAKRPRYDLLEKMMWVWDKELSYKPEEFSEAKAHFDYLNRVLSEMNNLRDKVRGHRLDLYRCWTKMITQKYETIIVDKLNLAQLSKLEADDGTPTNNLPEAARKNRVIASVGIFKEWLDKQALKVGSVIIKKSIKSSTICSDCGGKLIRKDSIIWACENCGSVFDQDVNAATNLIRSYQEEAA